jgi:hypothetical protein
MGQFAFRVQRSVADSGGKPAPELETDSLFTRVVDCSQKLFANIIGEP